METPLAGSIFHLALQPTGRRSIPYEEARWVACDALDTHLAYHHTDEHIIEMVNHDEVEQEQ